MGSTHHTGSTATRRMAVVGTAAILALAGCAAGSDGDDAASAATAAEMEAP
jgi:hypothetical protein